MSYKVGEIYTEVNNGRPFSEWRVTGINQLTVIKKISELSANVGYTSNFSKKDIMRWIDNGVLILTKESAVKKLLRKIDDQGR